MKSYQISMLHIFTRSMRVPMFQSARKMKTKQKPIKSPKLQFDPHQSNFEGDDIRTVTSRFKKNLKIFVSNFMVFKSR